MPFILHGAYYTAKELARQIDMKYSTFSDKIRDREGIINVGQTLLIPEALAKLIAEELDVSNYKESTSIAILAKELHVQPSSLEAIISYGLPVYKKNGKERLMNDCIPYLKKAVEEIVAKEGFFPSDMASKCCERTLELMEQSRND